ncbi:MAG: hypothetical protein NC324_09230 [Bacteroides sp.]|nr:hypothetical protein [Bacteroides sp.]
MLKDIVSEVMEALSGIKALRYVAEDWGQLNYEQPPVQWPCALIDVQGITCTNLGNGGLMGDCTFSVQLVNRPVQRTSAGAPKAQQAQNLLLFELIDGVLDVLHAREGECHSPFVLRETRKDNAIDLQGYTLTFVTSFKTERSLAPVRLSGANISFDKKKAASRGGFQSAKQA